MSGGLHFPIHNRKKKKKKRTSTRFPNHPSGSFKAPGEDAKDSLSSSLSLCALSLQIYRHDCWYDLFLAAKLNWKSGLSVQPSLQAVCHREMDEDLGSRQKLSCRQVCKLSVKNRDRSSDFTACCSLYLKCFLISADGR